MNFTSACRPDEFWADSGGGHAVGAAGAVHGDALGARVGGICVRPAAVAAAAAAAAVHPCSALAVEHGCRTRTCKCLEAQVTPPVLVFPIPSRPCLRSSHIMPSHYFLGTLSE